MTDMNAKDQWEDKGKLTRYLAKQLINGRLGLFLGAGVSQFYGLPNWEDLIKGLCAMHGEPFDPKDNFIQKAAFIKSQHYKGEERKFNIDLKKILYDGAVLDFVKLRQNPTLSAIGSLVMSSRRGSAARVFTLNYDDLLENYLEYHGFTTSIIWQERHWAQNDDVVIYHPHGFLPLADRPDSDRVVLGSVDYHEIMRSLMWRPLLETSLRTHTFLYIGLSGTDDHLQSLLVGLTDLHAIAQERVAYHGVRFAIDGKRDEIAPTFDGLKVFTHKLSSYDDLPDFLFGICQAAREQRMSA